MTYYCAEKELSFNATVTKFNLLSFIAGTVPQTQSG